MGDDEAGRRSAGPGQGAGRRGGDRRVFPSRGLDDCRNTLDHVYREWHEGNSRWETDVDDFDALVLLAPYLERALKDFAKLKPAQLLDERYKKFRRMGVFEK